ncbi:MAG: ATP-dependent zinc metalloprotease FtsH, partial [Aeoliella sp.]
MAAPPGWILLLLLLATLFLLSRSMSERRSEITYSFFDRQVQEGNVRTIEIRGQQAFGEFRVPPLQAELEAETDPTDEVESTTDDATVSEDSETSNGPETNDPPPKEAEQEEAERLEKLFVVTLLHPYPDDDLFRFWRSNDVDSIDPNPPPDYATLLYAIWIIILVAMMVGMWYFLRRTRDQMMGGGILGGVTKSPARRFDGDGEKVTFDDVAGLEGVKRDLKEVVEFLKDPAQFQRLGAHVPKGVLLMGPPGTGKTLLAKAVAGEAGVPFFSINGSEFIQLFVGVGASRVRDMFKNAKAAAPSILFIDEIDAVGRQRGAGLGGGNDEREQTLNQILSEMDGFTTTTSVILIAATNRPDVLDPALLRPGRFDRHVTVDRPTVEARRELFEVHTREMPIADDVEFDRLARATVGLTGADIRNLANEAALWATRRDQDSITMDDFEHARDKVLMGARRDDVLTEDEKKVTAYHEAGHTLLAWFLPGSDRVHKVTIIPRGRALGVTQLVPE